MNPPSPFAGEQASLMEPAHIHRLQCSRQWRGFLAALAQEFVSALPPEELATLMARIGTRFAVAHPLPNSDTVRGLQDAMNGIWDPLDWGRAELGQNPAGMEVVHHFSPLVAAFGDTHAAWATGFLKGVYQQWFDAAGGSGLRVEVTTAADALGSARLHLAAAA